ncbi:MAG: hypothetical protein IPL52_00750 [Flavobacteriales bacterium]|nr:hypothetical protein [Flavobacteriales bacterium]
MGTRTKIILGVALAAVVGGLYGLSEFNREPETAAQKKAVEIVSATELHDAFLSDETAANARYVGTSEQAIRFTGIVRSVEEPYGGKVSVVLETADALAGIVCEFEESAVPAAWKVGDRVSLKGICTGVNDLIPDVILVRCVAVE